MTTTVTTHDIEANGTKYILEWTHDDEGKGHIAITEACDCTEDEGVKSCDYLETYDFKETE